MATQVKVSQKNTSRLVITTLLFKGYRIPDKVIEKASGRRAAIRRLSIRRIENFIWKAKLNPTG
jgi:hypothetical protein